MGANGYNKDSMPCVKCGIKLKNIADDDHHPMGGLSFETAGHYGSAFFDPMDSSRLAIAICDACVRVVDENGGVYKWSPDAP